VKTPAKILWGEGLFLKPQHFQRQDLYHEARLAQMCRVLHPYAWGLSRLSVDRDALATGTLRLHEVSAVFPDGEPYSAPDGDALPEAVNLANLPTGSDSWTFHLALAPLREGSSNLGAPQGNGGIALRYVQQDLATQDLFTAAVDGPVATLRKQVRLLGAHERLGELISLPLLRLRSTGSGGFELDAQFLPPATAIDAQPQLLQLVQRLLDVIQAKCSALYGHQREPSKNIVEFRSGDAASFWFLHTASGAYAELSHLFHQPRLHPERLFQVLLRITGQLMTFSKSYGFGDLPAYQHVEPAPAFHKLDRMLRDLLETVISTRYVGIALTETKPSFYAGRLESEKLSKNAAFYLAVAADLPPAELVESVPVRLKMGCAEDVDKLVVAAMPGVRITHAPQVPAAIPVRPNSYYFAIEPHGALYERMLQAQSVAIYVPSGFRELKLELLAVLQ